MWRCRQCGHHEVFGSRRELEGRLGKNYPQVIEQLNTLLTDFDLEVKKVIEESSAEPKQVVEPRYLVTLKGTLSPKEPRMSGWRIDNLAALAVTISYVVSKQGRAPREEVEKILSNKLGRWKSLTLLDVFVRSGYIDEDLSGTLSLGWRAKAEVDLPALMALLAETKP